MGNRFVKNGNGNKSGLVLPNNGDVLLEVVITRAGTQLKSPLPPNEVCKLLQNLCTDLMYQSFQPVEQSKLHSA